MKPSTQFLLATALCVAAQSSSAQGGFVLFGDSGTAPQPEHKAVRPLTAPYFNEDAFVTTDLRAWYVNQALQDTNEYRLWFSANKGFDRLHLGFAANYRIAEGDDANTFGAADMITLHARADYYVSEWFSPVIEISGYFVTDEGSVGAPFSGVDAVAVGGGEDEDKITGALGAELRPFGPDLGLRLAYETELSDKVSLFGHRWTFSTVYEF